MTPNIRSMYLVARYLLENIVISFLCPTSQLTQYVWVIYKMKDLHIGP